MHLFLFLISGALQWEEAPFVVSITACLGHMPFLGAGRGCDIKFEGGSALKLGSWSFPGVKAFVGEGGGTRGYL